MTAQPDRPAGSPVAVLRRSAALIALVVLCFVAAGLTFSLLQTPMYRAETSVLIDSTTIATNPNAASQEVSSEEVSTQRLVMESETVAKRVVDEVGLEVQSTTLLDAVTVEPVGDARVLLVTVLWDDPDTAAQVANGFAKAYLEYRDEQQAVRARAVGGARASARTAATPVGEVLTPAVPDPSPSNPSPLAIAVLCGVLGLLVGLILAFLRRGSSPSSRPTEPG